MTRLYAGLYPKIKKAKIKQKIPKKLEAVIEDIKLYINNPYFKEFGVCHPMSELTNEPQGKPDLVVVTLKTEGKIKKETFAVSIKYDGMLEPDALTRVKRLRRQRFVKFLRQCGITANMKEYNVPSEIGKLKGKKITMTLFS